MNTNKGLFLTNRQLTQAAMFIALMAISANLTSFITIGAVPLTFQTVVAILSGILLGKKVGAFSMIGYVIVGLIGVPIFAGFQGGVQTIFMPTFGFILSFIIIAFVIGLIYEKWRKKNFFSYFLLAYIGLAINYSMGIMYLYFYSTHILGSSDISIMVITIGMIPFIIKDTILASGVALISPKLLRALRLTKK